MNQMNHHAEDNAENKFIISYFKMTQDLFNRILRVVYHYLPVGTQITTSAQRWKVAISIAQSVYRNALKQSTSPSHVTVINQIPHYIPQQLQNPSQTQPLNQTSSNPQPSEPPVFMDEGPEDGKGNPMTNFFRAQLDSGPVFGMSPEEDRLAKIMGFKQFGPYLQQYMNANIVPPSPINYTPPILPAPTPSPPPSSRSTSSNRPPPLQIPSPLNLTPSSSASGTPMSQSSMSQSSLSSAGSGKYGWL